MEKNTFAYNPIADAFANGKITAAGTISTIWVLFSLADKSAFAFPQPEGGSNDAITMDR